MRLAFSAWVLCHAFGAKFATLKDGKKNTYLILHFVNETLKKMKRGRENLRDLTVSMEPVYVLPI
jgi:hypothetical protein